MIKISNQTKDGGGKNMSLYCKCGNPVLVAEEWMTIREPKLCEECKHYKGQAFAEKMKLWWKIQEKKRRQQNDPIPA